MDRPPAQRFEDLLVWQKSHAIVLAVYRVTRVARMLGAYVEALRRPMR